jgi:aminoglycoside N3'-acetyltransferase
VEVHSSLSRLGWVQGGAAAVVDALMSVISEEGAIVMSAYPVSKVLSLSEVERERGILAKVRIYLLDYAGPTGMGVIADEFRHKPGVILGSGFHRVCAWGGNASLYSEGYHRLLENDGWVLLLGVGIGYCSSMHQAEKAGIPPEIKECFKVPGEIRQDYPDDIYISYGSTPDDAWTKVEKVAEQRGLIKKHKIGDAECMLFKAKEVVEIYEQALRIDPFGLFGMKRGNGSENE